VGLQRAGDVASISGSQRTEASQEQPVVENEDLRSAPTISGMDTRPGIVRSTAWAAGAIRGGGLVPGDRELCSG
jgi:hypothetical protein